MNPFLIVGNWKSNKTTTEAMEWLRNFQFSISNFQLKNTSIILCVPFILLYPLKKEIDRLHVPLALGAQDVSPFPKGAFTGEVAANQIKELADWVIIGHSERRAYFHETDEELVFEVEQAKQADLNVIFCVSDINMIVPHGVDVIAYEPIASIGTGKNMSAGEAADMLQTLKKKTGITRALYGGSVTPETVRDYSKVEGIDGVLVGGASLDPTAFFQLIDVASSYM